MVGQLRCLECGYTERRAVDLLDIAARRTSCPACQSKLLDYEFNVFHWNWVTDRIAVGGRIPDREAMDQLRRSGITHLLSVATEEDDTELAAEFELEFLLNGCDDDYEPKPPEFFAPAVDYVLRALKNPQAKVHIHCAAGARRSIMMVLAVLRAQGLSQDEAIRLITEKRAAAQFVPAYVESVENYLRFRAGADHLTTEAQSTAGAVPQEKRTRR